MHIEFTVHCHGVSGSKYAQQLVCFFQGLKHLSTVKYLRINALMYNHKFNTRNKSWLSDSQSDEIVRCLIRTFNETSINAISLTPFRLSRRGIDTMKFWFDEYSYPKSTLLKNRCLTIVKNTNKRMITPL